jgi:peptidoglycan pentaglycine glycine transferase (the first glycine)
VTKGPLLSGNDDILEDLVMNQVHKVSKANHIRYLVVQPPNNRQDLSTRMSNWGFKGSLMPFAPAPYTTLLIDLRKDLNDILARMRAKTRYNIHLAERSGISVREGTEQDLSIFYRTLLATRERQNFTEYPEEYWNRFYRTFSACGYTKLFFSEYSGEVISSILLVNFGDTVIFKKGGWMGNHKELHPNELLHWEAIQWAKHQGYHYYDFEGILPEAAKAIQQEGSIPKIFQGTVTWFKLGFGGKVTFYPGAFDYFYNPVLRWIYLYLFAKVRDRSEINYLINRFIRS